MSSVNERISCDNLSRPLPIREYQSMDLFKFFERFLLCQNQLLSGCVV